MLPFGSAGSVEHIVQDDQHRDGSFEVTNLMGERATATPTRLINAVIDRGVPHRPAGVRTCDDVVEVD